VKILVGVKHVPDTEAKVKVAADGVSLDETGVKMDVSPYDEYALEEALKTREAKGEGEVVVVSAGGDGAQTSLRKGLAMGADRAVLVKDDRYDRADGLARARALAAVARLESPGLILLGKYGVGTDENQTGPMLAELLDLPQALGVSELEIGDGSFTAKREIEGAVEVLEGSLPAVISAEKGLNEPRYPALKGIMAAKRKPLDVKTPEELGLDPVELGEGARVVWEGMELPEPRAAGRILDGEPAEAVADLVRALREEAKVI
jgi:electron transfer flavoprotein beta subunit